MPGYFEAFMHTCNRFYASCRLPGRILSITLFLLLSLSLSSCVAVYWGFGIRPNVPQPTAADIAGSGRRLGIPGDGIVPAGMRHRIESVRWKGVRKDYMQPLQSWLYVGDSLVDAQINCYARGYPNLKWHTPAFDTGLSDMMISHYAGFTEHMRWLTGAAPPPSGQKGRMIIVWSSVLGRQNRRFVRKMQAFLQQNPSVEAFWFNNDAGLY